MVYLVDWNYGCREVVANTPIYKIVFDKNIETNHACLARTAVDNFQQNRKGTRTACARVLETLVSWCPSVSDHNMK